MDVSGISNLSNYSAPLPKASVAASQAFTLPAWQGSKTPTGVTPAQHKAAQEYEGVYITQMLSPMFETVETDKEFGGGESEKIYQSMMVQEYGKQIAARGGMGLAKYIENDLAHNRQQQTTLAK